MRPEKLEKHNVLTSSAGAASRLRFLKKFHFLEPSSQDDLSQAKLRVRCGDCGEVCIVCAYIVRFPFSRVLLSSILTPPAGMMCFYQPGWLNIVSSLWSCNKKVMKLFSLFATCASCQASSVPAAFFFRCGCGAHNADETAVPLHLINSNLEEVLVIRIYRCTNQFLTPLSSLDALPCLHRG